MLIFIHFLGLPSRPCTQPSCASVRLLSAHVNEMRVFRCGPARCKIFYCCGGFLFSSSSFIAATKWVSAGSGTGGAKTSRGKKGADQIEEILRSLPFGILPFESRKWISSRSNCVSLGDTASRMGDNCWLQNCAKVFFFFRANFLTLMYDLIFDVATLQSLSVCLSDGFPPDELSLRRKPLPSNGPFTRIQDPRKPHKYLWVPVMTTTTGCGLFAADNS